MQTPASVAQSNPLNPETISLAALVLGMLLIALVSVGGFTVLAQRRLRSIGMLESTGATDRHVRLVVRANGTVVGVVGAILGFVLGLVVWLAYRPSLEQSAHHVIGVFALLVDRGRRRDGARGRGGLLRGVPSGAGDHQGADRPRAVGSAGAASSDPPLRASLASSSSSPPSCCSATPAARTAGTGVAVRRSSCSGSSSSSPG